MFKIAYAVSWMLRQIRHLFKARPYHLNPGTWICVIRNGNLIVTRCSSFKSGDYEVMRCLLNPRQIPSLLTMSLAIRKHWPVLKPLALTAVQSA